uniref:Uncharacterized protein n=1 Tax=Anguilla anguilla TaxID=7936 RepID=A0A0E9U1T5_ANGAN
MIYPLFAIYSLVPGTRFIAMLIHRGT